MMARKTKMPNPPAAPIYAYCSKCQGCITWPAAPGARSCNCATPTFYAGHQAMGSKTRHYVLVGAGKSEALCGAPLYGYAAGRHGEPEVCAKCMAKLPTPA